MARKKIKITDDTNSYSRKFNLELYHDWVSDPDAEIKSYDEIIKYITDNYKNYIYIVHDRDIWTIEDYAAKSEYMDSRNIKPGDKKKKHTHVVVSFSNPRYRFTVAKELGIDKQNIKFITPTRDYKKSLKYLLHEGYDDKEPYYFDETVGTLKKDLLKFCKKDISEEDKSEEVIDLITSRPYWTLPALLKEINNRGLYSHFRQGFSIYKMIWENNNVGVYRDINPKEKLPWEA